MAKRSYGQHCSLAVGLDLLAERWSLLVIRELLPGGRRFTELFESLPGISTDLLTARLRSLEDAGVIERSTVRHPAKAVLYRLTPWGEELRPILAELARWGVRLLPEPGHADYELSHRSALAASTLSCGEVVDAGSYQFTVDGDDMTITVANGQARLYYGPAHDGLVMHVAGTVDDFFAWAGSTGAELADGTLHTGDLDMLRKLMTCLPGAATD